jgi:O-antigen ligase
LVLALTIPFVWLSLRGRGRIAVVGYIAGAVALTGSRTAQVTAVAALLALVVLRPDSNVRQREATGAPVREIASIVGVVALGALGALLPLLALTGAGAFGDRTFFWRKALDGIIESPLLGHGGAAWPRLYEISEIPIAASYSPHNQWLDVGYSSGLVGLALFVVLLGHLLLRTRTGIRTAGAILIPMLAASTLERPWSFAINDSLTFTLLAALLCIPNVVGPEPDEPSPSFAAAVARADAPNLAP